MPLLFSLCCDSNVKNYLIFSDETGKKLSPLTLAAEIKLKRQWDSQRNVLKVSVLLLEYGKIAYFQIQPHQAGFFSWMFVEELAYSWPACFENLSLSLLYSSPCLSVQDGFRGKNTPSDLTLSSWHSQAVKLTASGVWPSKWTGHNKALTQGSPSVTAYVSTHSYRHIEKHIYTWKGQSITILLLLNTHTLTHSTDHVHAPTLLLWLG